MNNVTFQDTSIAVVFLVGKNGDGLDSKLEKESQQFNDILRADFKDHYYNLTLKSLFTLKFYLGFWEVRAIIRTKSNTSYQYFLISNSLSGTLYCNFRIPRKHQNIL